MEKKRQKNTFFSTLYTTQNNYDKPHMKRIIRKTQAKRDEHYILFYGNPETTNSTSHTLYLVATLSSRLPVHSSPNNKFSDSDNCTNSCQTNTCLLAILFQPSTRLQASADNAPAIVLPTVMPSN